MKKILTAGLILMLVVGCRGEQQAADSGESEAGDGEMTMSPTVVPTKTLEPTYTLLPTNTITSTPKPSNTPEPTNTPFPFPTPNDAYFVENSPNNKWIVWERWSGNNDHTLLVQNVNTSTTWELQYFVTITEQLKLPLLIRPIHWSREGQYLYFTGMGMGEGGGEYHGVSLIKRLDLESGEIANVLTFDTHFISFTPSFTPNGKYFTYLLENVLTFRNLQNSNETSLTIEEIDTSSSGDMLWSPDNINLVFTTQHSDFSISIVAVNRQKLTYNIYPQPKTIIASAKEWINEIEVLFLAHYPNESKEIILNIETGEIREVKE